MVEFLSEMTQRSNDKAPYLTISFFPLTPSLETIDNGPIITSKTEVTFEILTKTITLEMIEMISTDNGDKKSYILRTPCPR